MKVNLTELLQELNEDIKPYLKPPAPPLPPLVPPGMISWTDNPTIEVVDFVLNEMVGTDGPFGMNTLFKSLTNSSGMNSILLCKCIREFGIVQCHRLELYGVYSRNSYHTVWRVVAGVGRTGLVECI